MTGGLELGGFAILVLWAHAGYEPAGMTRGLEDGLAAPLKL